MRKTEVYQIRLDSQEKKLAFAVFKQLGITPAQAVRLFFKQVVLTKSIPFAIENQNIDMDQLFKLRQKNRVQSTPYENNEQPTNGLAFDQEHDDLFDELNALLGESEKH